MFQCSYSNLNGSFKTKKHHIQIWLSKCNTFRGACKKRRNISDSICWCEWRQITPSLADDAALLNQNIMKINKPKEDTGPVLTHWMKHEHQLTSGDDDLTVGWAVSHFRSSIPLMSTFFKRNTSTERIWRSNTASHSNGHHRLSHVKFAFNCRNSVLWTRPTTQSFFESCTRGQK